MIKKTESTSPINRHFSILKLGLYYKKFGLFQCKYKKQNPQTEFYINFSNSWYVLHSWSTKRDIFINRSVHNVRITLNMIRKKNTKIINLKMKWKFNNQDFLKDGIEYKN